MGTLYLCTSQFLKSGQLTNQEPPPPPPTQDFSYMRFAPSPPLVTLLKIP